MSSSAIEAIIGGIDSPTENPDGSIIIDGTVPVREEDMVDPREELWLSDLELGNYIFGAFGTAKVAFVTFMWFFWYLGGTRLDAYYWWTWFSATVVVYVAWGPVAFAWIAMNFGDWIRERGTAWRGEEFANKYLQFGYIDTLFLYAALISTIGPMVGYFIPLSILVFAYNQRGYTGLVYNSELQFWLGWWLGALI